MSWAQTIIGLVAAIATVVAAVAAVKAVVAARETISVAERTAKIADAAARADERDRLRARIVRVGEIVEQIFWAAHKEQPDWMAARNRLRHALVGLTDRLPVCAELPNVASTPGQAVAAASRARDEVEGVLHRLEGGLDQMDGSSG